MVRSPRRGVGGMAQRLGTQGGGWRDGSVVNKYLEYSQDPPGSTQTSLTPLLGGANALFQPLKISEMDVAHRPTYTRNAHITKIK